MEKSIKVALFGNISDPSKAIYAQNLLDALERRGACVGIDIPFFESLQKTPGMNLPQSVIPISGDFQAHLAVSMGGDGTFLTAAKRVGASRQPNNTRTIWSSWAS